MDIARNLSCSERETLFSQCVFCFLQSKTSYYSPAAVSKLSLYLQEEVNRSLEEIGLCGSLNQLISQVVSELIDKKHKLTQEYTGLSSRYEAIQFSQ